MVWSDDDRDRVMKEGRAAYEEELLERYAVYKPHRGRYLMRSDPYDSRYLSRDEALNVIRVHLGLGLEPTVVVKLELLVALYDRLVALEATSKISG